MVKNPKSISQGSSSQSERQPLPYDDIGSPPSKQKPIKKFRQAPKMNANQTTRMLVSDEPYYQFEYPENDYQQLKSFEDELEQIDKQDIWKSVQLKALVQATKQPLTERHRKIDNCLENAEDEELQMMEPRRPQKDQGQKEIQRLSFSSQTPLERQAQISQNLSQERQAQNSQNRPPQISEAQLRVLRKYQRLYRVLFKIIQSALPMSMRELKRNQPEKFRLLREYKQKYDCLPLSVALFPHNPQKDISLNTIFEQMQKTRRDYQYDIDHLDHTDPVRKQKQTDVKKMVDIETAIKQYLIGDNVTTQALRQCFKKINQRSQNLYGKIIERIFLQNMEGY